MIFFNRYNLSYFPVAGVGDIVNTEHGFTIQLDVQHFTRLWVTLKPRRAQV